MNGPGFKKIIGISVACLLLVPAISSNVYSFELNDAVAWQLVYVKHLDCKNPDETKADGFAELSGKYLKQYKLENYSYESSCISLSEFENYQRPHEVDLLIVIFDSESGKQLLHSADLDGLYAHGGNDRSRDHTVILCDCTDDKTSFETALSPWVLSHELSHFVLSYKGYSKSAIQGIVHEKEDYYIEHCLSSLENNEDCNDIKMIIRTESPPRDFVVMAPHKPAIGNTLVDYVSDGIGSEVIDLQRQITKNWLAGKINNEAYLDTIKYLVDSPVETVEEVPAFLEIKNGFVIAEISRNIETDWKDLLHDDTSKQEKVDNLMNYLMIQFSENALEDFDDFPHWFKARALMWTEGKISNKVFFDGVEHLIRMGTIQVS